MANTTGKRGLEEFIKGSVIVFPFPFSDLSEQKRRPALVISVPSGRDLIVCQITSHFHLDSYSIPLDNNDFVKGSLNLNSYIRPNKLISIDKRIVLYKAGLISSDKLETVIKSVIDIISL